MKRDTILRTYHYFIEAYLLYIVIFLYYMFSNTLPPIIPFITLVGGTGLLVFLIFLKSKKQSFLTFLTAAVVTLLVGIALNYQIELLIILAGFMLWRIPILVNEAADSQNEGGVLVFSFAVGVIYFISAAMMDYPFRNLILILTALQVIFIIIGRFIKGLMTGSYANEQTRKKQTNWLIKMIGITTGGIALLALSLPAIKWLFFFLLKTIFLVLSIPFMPLLYWLMSIESLQKYWESEGEADVEDGLLENVFEGIEAKEQVDFSNLWVLVSAVIIIITAIIVYKKYRSLAQGSERQNDSLLIRSKSSDMVNSGRSIFRRRQKPPKDYVRKLFYDLENIGAKKKLGRHSAETAKQWFDRVGLSEHDDVIQSYEKVRYDETSLSKEEIEKYDIVIKEIKEKLNKKDG